MTKKVLFELDAVGEEDIWTQVLKLSDETCKLPEHVEFEVLVVMVEVVIPSEKVTELLSVSPGVAESAGEDEETDGAVVSVSTIKEVIVSELLTLPVASETVIVQFE